MTSDIWPGIGLSDKPVDWAKFTGSAALSAKSTAGVERRRKQGSDFSTFRGISRKSDEMSARGAPATIRPKRAPGDVLHPESKSGQIRAVLKVRGPMTRAQICHAVGIEANTISAYLHNDVKQGRVLKIVKEGSLQKFALAGYEVGEQA